MSAAPGDQDDWISDRELFLMLGGSCLFMLVVLFFLAYAAWEILS